MADIWVRVGNLDFANPTWPHRGCLGGQDLNDRTEQSGQTFEIVNPDFRQGPNVAFVVPARPGRTCVSIKGTGRVHMTDRAIANSPPQNPEGRSELHERCGK